MVVLLLCALLCLLEELSCSLGECTGEGIVTDFAHDEVAVACTRCLAIEGEGILALISQSRIEAEHMPVACCNSLLLLGHGDAHTALDTVVDTGSIADDEGRSVVCLSLTECLECLVVVSTHSALCNVDIAVAHSDLSEVLLLDGLTGCRELCNGADRCCFGSLTAGIGVNFCVEYENVDVLTGSQHVIQTAEADIVCPAVTTEDPHGLLGEEVLVSKDLLDCLAAGAHCLKLCDELVGSCSVGSGVVKCGEVFLSGSLCGSRSFIAAGDLLDIFLESVADSSLSEVHTKTELCVVFKEGVAPSRAEALLVDGVRSGRCGAAPDGGTACCVGVRSLAAACTSAGELEQRLLELASLDGGIGELSSNLGLLVERLSIIEYCLLVHLCCDGLHGESLLALLAGTYGDTAAAACAVEGGNGHSELEAGQTGHISCLGACGSSSNLSLCHSDRTDNCVRADHGTEVTLDTICEVPFGNVNSDAALLISSGALGQSAVHGVHEGGDRQLVALLCVDRNEDIVDELDQLGSVTGGNMSLRVVCAVLPCLGNLNLNDSANTGIDSIVVHLDNGFALLAVGLGSRILHELDSILDRDNAGEFEERCLQNGIHTAAQTDFLTDLDSVDGVELDVVVCDVLLDLAGEGCS